jgi:hypothetical protein
MNTSAAQFEVSTKPGQLQDPADRSVARDDSVSPNSQSEGRNALARVLWRAMNGADTEAISTIGGGYPRDPC